MGVETYHKACYYPTHLVVSTFKPAYRREYSIVSLAAIYLFSMVSYAVATGADRVEELLKNILMFLGALFLSVLSCGTLVEFRTLKDRTVVLLGSLAEVGSGVIGIVCPPLALYLDEKLYENKVIREHLLFFFPLEGKFIEELTDEKAAFLQGDRLITSQIRRTNDPEESKQFVARKTALGLGLLLYKRGDLVNIRAKVNENRIVRFDLLVIEINRAIAKLDTTEDSFVTAMTAALLKPHLEQNSLPMHLMGLASLLLEDPIVGKLIR